jgi:acyl-CoA synthetase (AMP-forming)/AMP-acid ligase II
MIGWHQFAEGARRGSEQAGAECIQVEPGGLDKLLAAPEPVDEVANRIEPDELREYIKQRVAAYKYPRLVWLVDELAKGPTGKILKNEIQVPARVTAGHA